MDLEEFRRYKKLIDEASHKASRLDGAIQQLEKELKEKTGCSNKEGVTKLLATLQKDKERCEAQYEEELKKFKEKYGERL